MQISKKYVLRVFTANGIFYLLPFVAITGHRRLKAVKWSIVIAWMMWGIAFERMGDPAYYNFFYEKQ